MHIWTGFSSNWLYWEARNLLTNIFVTFSTILLMSKGLFAAHFFPWIVGQYFKKENVLVNYYLRTFHVYRWRCVCMSSLYNKIKVHLLQISPDKSFLLCMHGCLCLFVLLLSFFLPLILLSPWVSLSFRIRTWRSQSVGRYSPSTRAIHSTGMTTSRSTSTCANFLG